jgi:aminoglycoside phosphotransferase (APT) family kinase protein
MVLKQALEKLRVEQDWRSRRDRTLREATAMQAIAPLLDDGAVPRVLFIDEANWIYAMEAAPVSMRDWKSELLAGRADAAVAHRAGEILSSMARQTWLHPEWEHRFGDQTVFDELRLDPYYRFTAARHPAVQAHFAALLAHCAERRVCLVHGDWSPKNLLTSGERVMAIDFEVVHYGDPCFDAGFLLNHLLLKSIHRPRDRAAYFRCAVSFWSAFAQGLPPGAAWAFAGTMAHLAGLLLARADGKSPAEYLTPPQRDAARSLAMRLIAEPARDLECIWECL